MGSKQTEAPPAGEWAEPSPEIRPLHHQVAGHVYSKSKTKLGLLEYGSGTILKPLQSGRRAESELNFYRSVFDSQCSCATLIKVRPLVPKFFGTVTLPQHPQETFLHLEDVTSGFSRPCIADIKLGRRTYDPLATPEKIAREEAKYPPAKELGFQFRGMRAYNDATDEFTTRGKDLRTFDENNIVQAFVLFFSDSRGLRRDAVAACLHKLRPLLKWFSVQTRFSFFASSVLLVYEGRRELPPPPPLPPLPPAPPAPSAGNGDTKAPPLANSAAISQGTSLRGQGTSLHDQGTSLCGQGTSLHDQGTSLCGQGTSLRPNASQYLAPVPAEGGPNRPLTDHWDSDACLKQTPEGGSSSPGSSRRPTSLPPRQESSNSCPVSEQESDSCNAAVRLIDFAHVFPGTGLDENNLHGLRRLVDILQGLLQLA